MGAAIETAWPLFGLRLRSERAAHHAGFRIDMQIQMQPMRILPAAHKASTRMG